MPVRGLVPTDRTKLKHTACTVRHAFILHKPKYNTIPTLQGRGGSGCL